jgi:hypothetical protein
MPSLSTPCLQPAPDAQRHALAAACDGADATIEQTLGEIAQ